MKIKMPDFLWLLPIAGHCLLVVGGATKTVSSSSFFLFSCYCCLTLRVTAIGAPKSARNRKIFPFNQKSFCLIPSPILPVHYRLWYKTTTALVPFFSRFHFFRFFFASSSLLRSNERRTCWEWVGSRGEKRKREREKTRTSELRDFFFPPL